MTFDLNQDWTGAHCANDGWYFRYNSQLFGPFSIPLINGRVHKRDLKAPAAKAGISSKTVESAILQDVQRELTFDELSEILDTTVKYDTYAKVLTFCAMLLAQTDEDQINVAFQGGSSIGKTYTPLEIVMYFPESERREYAGSSPTSFYHAIGETVPIGKLGEKYRGVFDAKELSDRRRRITVVDLEHMILIFIDQPHWQLAEKLRPLESHDRKLLRYQITDKSGKGGLRAKTVVILGFPSIFFCTASETQDEQERTRVLTLHPETSQDKLLASLQLLARKVGNRKAFRAWLQNHPKRQWLIERIRLIRASGITDADIPNAEKILERYLQGGHRLTPRTQRDFPRFLSFIKASALLNTFTRKKVDEHTIMANEKDIEYAFAFYEKVALPNELGLSFESWRVYNEILTRMPNAHTGVQRKEVLEKYLQLYGRALPPDRLQRLVIPELEAAGLIRQVLNPNDARESLIVLIGEENRPGAPPAQRQTGPAEKEIMAAQTCLEQQPGKQADYNHFVKVARKPVIQAMVDRGIIRLLTVDPPRPDLPPSTTVYLKDGK